MSGEERCIHEMLPGQCGVCNPPKNSSPFVARFYGYCALCKTAIEPGELICWTGDGTAVQHNRHR